MVERGGSPSGVFSCTLPFPMWCGSVLQLIVVFAIVISTVIRLRCLFLHYTLSCARTLLAIMSGSGASNGVCGPRRAPAADALYVLEVCKNSTVRTRACLAGDAGVVASSQVRVPTS